MGSIVSPELGLDLRALFVPKTIGDFLRDSSAIENVTERASNHQGFVQRLEEEMRKIDAFKRELPLCMLLLNDAIVYMKRESAKFELPKIVKPVLEEFMPLKDKDCEDEKEEGLICKDKKDKDCKDKKNWMSSVQLWNTEDCNITTTDPIPNQNNNKVNEKRHGMETEEEFPFCRTRNVVAERAFVPFKPFSGFPAGKELEEEEEDKRDGFSVRGLSLIKALKVEPISAANKLNSNTRLGSLTHHLQAARKQRRCWSPELHKRFVSALQQLGGSQVATPKQIRELMQVDGLTNDEVKSHLQKYRLHTRRVSNGSGSGQAAQTGTVLGGLWTSQDQYGGESSKGSSSQSGSPQGPFQLGPSLEDDDDAKSEGYSWKSHNKPGKKDHVYES